MRNEKEIIRVIWINDQLPKDDEFKFVKIGKPVSGYMLDGGKLMLNIGYCVARWKDGEWTDCLGNKITDVVAWSDAISCSYGEEVLPG